MRMRCRGSASLLVLALLIAVVSARADTSDLPYRIGGDGRVSTDVFVDGQGPYSFLLDTASSRTMLFDHLRRQLGLEPSAPGLLKVYAMNNIGTALPVTPRELRLADQKIAGLTLGVLPDDVRPPEGETAADGILGMDALANRVLVMDHETLRLKLLDPGATEADTYRKWPSAELIAYRGRDMELALWWLKAQFGPEEVTALLDMGSGITMINWIAAEKLGIHRASFNPASVSQALRDALGTTEPVVTVKGLTISLAGRTFDAQTVIVADAAVFRYFGLETKSAAIIGPALLRTNSLAIDFSRQRIYVGPATHMMASPS